MPGQPTRLLLLACVLVSGCASISEQECRSANWYQLGERDALIYGMRPQVDQLAYQCGKFGVQPDEKEYLAGWQVGNWEHARRASRSSGG